MFGEGVEGGGFFGEEVSADQVAFGFSSRPRV